MSRVDRFVCISQWHSLVIMLCYAVLKFCGFETLRATRLDDVTGMPQSQACKHSNNRSKYLHHLCMHVYTLPCICCHVYAAVFALPTCSLRNNLCVCSDLVVKVQDHLANAGFTQHPCLGCSKHNAKLAFAVWESEGSWGYNSRVLQYLHWIQISVVLTLIISLILDVCYKYTGSGFWSSTLRNVPCWAAQWQSLT